MEIFKHAGFPNIKFWFRCDWLFKKVNTEASKVFIKIESDDIGNQDQLNHQVIVDKLLELRPDCKCSLFFLVQLLGQTFI